MRMILTDTMKAMVYLGAGRIGIEDRPKPEIQYPTDAVVRIAQTTICGTDLHILKGDFPEVGSGRVLGHEGIGIVESAGGAVSNVQPGDRVLISCITSCGKCEFCRERMYSHCLRGGWMLGRTIDGVQAQYARIPFADTSLHPVPVDADGEALVMLSDVFPTGFEVGVLNGRVGPGDTVVIVGAGPIGLAALLTAQFFSPAQIFVVDHDENRLDTAQAWGASRVIRGDKTAVVDAVMRLTGGRGADVVIEAVGIPETFDICQSVAAPGGRVAIVGAFGKSAEIRLDKLWSRNIAITTGLVDTRTIPMLVKAVLSGGLDAKKMITHRYRFDEMMNAYEIVAGAPRERALKVLVSHPAIA